MINAKGGYALIDCTGIDLKSESAVTLSGLYARLTEAITKQKLVIACNVLFGKNNPITPIPVMVNFEDTQADADIICTAATLQIIVDKDEEVTINNLLE